jgi:hypothetical protein
MITASEAKNIRKAIDKPYTVNQHWSCWVVAKMCGGKVTRDYAKFFGQSHKARWDGLSSRIDRSTEEQNMQRELMLELFAHTRGKL